MSTEEDGAAILEALDKRVFEDIELDPLFFVREADRTDVDLSLDALQQQIDRHELALDEINERISERVMSNYDRFVAAMTSIRDLGLDLQMTAVLCKNGRRSLHRVQGDVTLSGLRVARDFTRARNTQRLCGVLEQVQGIRSLEQRLRAALEEGDFTRGIDLCMECRQAVVGLQRCSCVRELDGRLQSAYDLVEERLDMALREACRRFDGALYERTLVAHQLMGKSNAVIDKLQQYFLETIRTNARNVLYAHTLLSPENAQQPEVIKRMKWKQMCSVLHEDHFQKCLVVILEYMCELMQVHWRMCQWHEQRERSDDELERANSFADIRAGLDYLCKAMWDEMQRIVSTILTASSLASFKIDEFLRVLHSVNNFIDIGEEFSGAHAHKLRGSIKQQSRAYFFHFHMARAEDLHTMLENDMWARCPVAADFGVMDVKEFRAFITAPMPERDELTPSTTTPQKRADRDSFFRRYEREGNPFRAMCRDSGLDGGDDSSSSSGGGGNGGGSGSGSGSQQNGSGGGKTNTTADGGGNGGAKAAVAAASGDDEDAPAELLQDYVVEDDDDEGGGSGSGSGSRSNAGQNSGTSGDDGRGRNGASKTGGNDGKGSSEEDHDGGPVLTSTSINLVRYVGKYLTMMRILEPISSQVFVGITQLIEYYLYTVYTFFGTIVNQNEMSPKLRSTLFRIRDQLLRNAPAIVTAPGQDSGSGGGSDDAAAALKRSQSGTNLADAETGELHFSIAPATLSPMVELTSADRLYGLPERAMALESLRFCTIALETVKGPLKYLLPKSQGPLFDQFYDQTIGSVGELRGLIYRDAADQLVPSVKGLAATVGSLKWDLKDSLDNNEYVNALVRDFQMVASRLEAVSQFGGVPSEVRKRIWTYVCTKTMNQLVEGFSRARRCSNAGRALMSLDLSVLVGAVKRLMPVRPVPGYALAEGYVKAYYLTDAELFPWISENARRYTTKQLTNLVWVSACSMNKKQRQELVTRIEEWGA